jgi:transcriptional regulator with XRE-family HTH domain
LSTKSPSAIDRHIGTRIRTARNMASMSQGTLARKLGLTFQQVQKYEKGTNRVGAGRLQRIAEIFDVPMTFFFDGVPGVKSSDGVRYTNATTKLLSMPDGFALAQAFVAIPDPQIRRRIVDLTRTIAANSRLDK